MEKHSRREQEQLARREAILHAAKKIFAENGYERASMNQIAKLSDFTKRTLYQYFIDKADIYLTVLLQIYGDMNQFLMDLMQENLTGYEKVENLVFGYYQYYNKHESHYKILYDIGIVKNLTSNPKLQEFFSIDQSITNLIHNSIIEGQKDDSIDKHLNSQKTTHSIKFLLTGFFNQMTITGDSYINYIELTQDEFVHHTLNQILSILK